MRLFSRFRTLRNRGPSSSNSRRRPASKTKKPLRGFFETLEPRAMLSTVTTTTISVTNASPAYGSQVTLSATVNPAPPNGELVTFKDGTTPLGTAPLMGGTATFQTSTLSVGIHSIDATYNGDGTLLPSSSAIGPAPIITTVAGNGNFGYSGDGGPATSASLSNPFALAVDGQGNIFIADTLNNCVREVNASTGVITTVAGDGTQGHNGDGGPATAAELGDPNGVKVDAAGDLFITDGNQCVREVNLSGSAQMLPGGTMLQPGDITTVAGDGTQGYNGDGGPATAAELNDPRGIAVNAAGDLFIADAGNYRVREVNLSANAQLLPDGTTLQPGDITTVAGNGTYGYSGDGGPATSATLGWPQDVAVDATGNIFIADDGPNASLGNNCIREVNLTGSAELLPDGTLLQAGDITTVAGNSIAGYSGDGGPATAAELYQPQAVAVSAAGNVIIGDTDNLRVREIDPSTDVITTVAGNGNYGYSGDGGLAASASLSGPFGVAVDGQGDIFIADSFNNCIREVHVGAGVDVLANANVVLSPSAVSPGWGEPVTLTATITNSTAPGSLMPTGSVDFVDTTTNTDLGDAPLVNGVATLPLGGLGAAVGEIGMQTITANYSGDTNFAAASDSTTVTIVNGTTTSLQASPTVAISGQPVTLTATVAVDAPGTGTPTGTVDFSVLNTATNQTTDLTPVPVTLSPDTNDANATAALSNVKLPAGTYTVTATYSGDANNAGSSAVAGLTPTITTVAGNGIDAYSSGDGSPAQTASIALGNGGPSSLAVDSAGDLFIADPANNAIREVNLSGAPITLPDGNTIQPGQIGTVASGLDQPEGVAYANGNLYIADTGANLIQVLDLTAGPEPLFGQTVANGGIITIAGDGTTNDFIGAQGIHGIHSTIGYYEGQAATLAPVGEPEAIAVDKFGDVFIAVGASVYDQRGNYYRDAILEVSSTDAIEFVDGVGVPNQNSPPPGGLTSLAYDAARQRLYFSLESPGLVEYLDLNAQNPTYQDFFANAAITTTDIDGLATYTDIDGLAVDADGNLYMANSTGNAVQEVAANDINWVQINAFQGLPDLLQAADATNGNATTIAGNGTAGYSGDIGPATLAALSDPTGLAANASGELFIADTGNARVREVLPSSPLQIQILAATQISDVTAADLDTVAAVSPSFTLQAPTANDLTNLITAVNALTPPINNGSTQPVTVTLDLAAGTTYNDTDIALQPGVTLVLVGNGTSATFVGHSPALTLTTGNLEVENARFSTASAAPTIVVAGGSLTLRDDTVASSSGSSEPAVEVTGGTVDLGTAGSPGGNTLEVNGGGQLAYNTSGNPIPVYGDNVEVNAAQVSLSSSTLAPVTITVTTANDTLDSYSDSVSDLQNAAAADEPISLRDAITALDTSLSGPNTVAFDIQASGPQVINVSSALGELPAITVPTIIDGYSQSGALPNIAGIGLPDLASIQIGINGSELTSGSSANGLTIDSGHCVVQGLSIAGFNQGWAIQIGNAAGDVGNVIAGDFIGTDTTGKIAGGNAYGIAPGNYTLIGSSAQFSAVDAAGDSVGIDDSTIAGAIANELNLAMGPYISSGGSLYPAEENVISGNYSQLSGGYGISGGQNDVIAGNLIGPDAPGTQAIGNGIGIHAGQYELIGGTVPGTENIISGNGGNIPILTNPDFYTRDVDLGSHDELAGNLIGTVGGGGTASPPSDADNNPALTGQADIGVLVEDGQTAETIEQNTIDDHPFSGISLAYDSETNIVVADNTIENNGYVGIGIVANTSQNQFVGNTITGNGAVPTGTVANNGTLVDKFTGGPGIAVVSDGVYTASGNSFLENSIYENSGPGIDLGGFFAFNADGSPDFQSGSGAPDYGANDFQSAPAIQCAKTDGAHTAVAWNLQATADSNPEADQDIRLDFYADGQPQAWLGSVTVETNGSGMACGTADFAYVPIGVTITATATNLGTGDTSDFATGAAVQSTQQTISVSPAGTATSLGVSSTVVLTGQPVTLTATVTSSAGTPDGSVTFYENGAPLGSPVPLGADGTANLSTSLSDATDAPITQDITAQYNGDQINFNSSTSGSVGLQVLPDPSVTNSSIDADLQTAVQTATTGEAAASQPAAVTLQAATDDDAAGLITALNSIVAPTVNETATPVTVTLNLSGSTTYTNQTLSLQPGVTLVIQVNGATIDPDVPALTVTSGNVIVKGATFTESGQAPTILVTGGNVTLLNDTIESSIGYTEPAIEIDGGKVNLGTEANPDTLVVNGTGEFIENNTSSPVSTAGNTLVQGTPVITWAAPANISYGTALSSAQLDAAANVPGTFAYTPAAGTVLKAGANQTLSVAFTPSDTTDYASATYSVPITVSEVTPAIAWSSPASITYGTALSGTQLDATASVPGTFAYSPAAGTVLKAGANQTLSVTFTPTDTSDYSVATDSVTINVNKATPAIAWSNPASLTYGTALSGTQLDATANVAGTFVYSPAAGTVLKAGANQALSVTFTPSDTSDYSVATDSVTINVNKATPAIAWSNPASLTYGTALSGTQLDATANVAGTFVYSPAAGTVLEAGANQTLSVTFTPTDTSDYSAVTDNVAITVKSAGTTTTGSASSSSPSLGQSVTLTATVTAPAGAGTPTGTVDFDDTTTGIDLGSVSLSGGVAKLSAADLPPGSNTITLSYGGSTNDLASSTTVTVIVGSAILVIDPKDSGSLVLSGKAVITETGPVVVDSNSSTALQASGNAQLTATVIDVVGGVEKSGNAVFHPTPVTGSAAVADPLAGLASPAAGASEGAVNLAGNSSLTINPGVYSEIIVSGNAHLTLNSGIYEIAGGGFNISGNATVNGSGVMIYNAGSAFPKTGGTFGSINLSGNSSVTLTAATTGADSGISIFQSRDNTIALQISGNAMLGATTLYAPSAGLVLSGNSNLSGALIVDQLSLSGNADPSPVLPERNAGSADDGQGLRTRPATTLALVATFPTAYEPASSEATFSTDSTAILPFAFPESEVNKTIPVASWSGPFGSGAGDATEPWWPHRADNSGARQPETGLTPAMQQVADAMAIDLRSSVSKAGQVAAVDAAMAAFT